MSKTILYIHGLGGGADSRIPSILKEHYAPLGVTLYCHTYDFDPEKAAKTIASWVENYKPDLIIGESLGSIQALRISLDIPHLFVSPALGAPGWLSRCAWLTWIPGIRQLFNLIYKPVEGGDRQYADFRYHTLRKYQEHEQKALKNIALGTQHTGPLSNSKNCFAFFGTHDHYLTFRIVSIKRWEKLFGEDSYALYNGTHFMENEYLYSLLIPKIDQILA